MPAIPPMHGTIFEGMDGISTIKSYEICVRISPFNACVMMKSLEAAALPKKYIVNQKIYRTLRMIISHVVNL